MTSIEREGLCGAEQLWGETSPCRFERGHLGPHSWESSGINIVTDGITHDDIVRRAAGGDPAARAILAAISRKKRAP
jgi:hypothetical protein